MLLSVLLQAAAAGVGVSKLGAALGAGLAVIGAGRLVVLPWKPLHASRKHREIFV
mgnify:CR=1 FL=1